MRDSRESALSVRILFERAATGGNGVGKLVADFFLNEQSWYSYSETERYHMEKLIRRFARLLRETGFLPARDAQGRPTGDDLPSGKG